MSTPTNRRLFLASGTAATVFAALGVAVAAEPTTFDPAGYVKLWRDAGNETVLSFRRDGRVMFGFYNPDGMRPPSCEDQRRWGALQKADPDWYGKTLDYLLAEDDRASVFDL